MYYLAKMSLEQGLFPLFTFEWAWRNFSDAVSAYRTQFVRSLEYAGLATAIALVISYPLAYWIAFRGGRWKNLFLLLVIAPFFVTYLIRTLAWQTILSDGGIVVDDPPAPAHPRRRRPAARDLGGRRRRHHLQLPAVHGAAAVREPRAGRPRG